MERIGQHVIVFLPWNSIELEAQQQILNTARMPFVFKHVAVMPDCHYGKGATVGTVLATTGAVIPAAVGVDIGCGMIAVRTPLKRTDIRDPRAVRAGIERRIPMSAGRNNTTLSPSASARVAALERLAKETRANPDQYDKNWRLALGTLGGGNHFIELAEDADGVVWLTLHSGSRGVGNRIGNHYIKVAQDLCRKERISLPDRDLAYLTEDHPAFAAYLRDLQWAQQFALLNRAEMMDRVLAEVSVALHGVDGHEREIEVQRINSHHNFTQQEEHFGARVWVTRKGAIEANAAQLGHDSRLDGHTQLHRLRQGALAELLFGTSWRRPPILTHEGPRAVQHGGPGPSDGRHRVPAIEGAARRNPGSLQGHRRGDGARERLWSRSGTS